MADSSGQGARDEAAVAAAGELGSTGGVGVVGLGTMGAGIVEVFARSGLPWSAWTATRSRSPAAVGTSRRRPTGRSAAAS